jgi:hypothetical protein
VFVKYEDFLSILVKELTSLLSDQVKRRYQNDFCVEWFMSVARLTARNTAGPEATLFKISRSQFAARMRESAMPEQCTATMQGTAEATE